MGSLLLLVLLAAMPATAAAAPVTINFDDLPAGTTISNQYVMPNLAGKGVRFGIRRDGTAAAPLRVDTDGDATSPPHLARAEGEAGEMCDNHDNAIWGKFEFARDHVSLKMWGFVFMRLRGYGGNGAQVASSGPLTPPSSALEPLEISAPPGKSIAYFKVEPTSGCYPARIDDVTFDDLAGVPLPDPDFGLSSDSASIGVLREGSTTIPASAASTARAARCCSRSTSFRRGSPRPSSDLIRRRRTSSTSS